MKKKSILKIIVDVIMIILMLLEYSKIYTGQLIHELCGVILLILFITHNILNISFYKSLFKGKYNINRIIMTIINIGFLLCMLLTIILGIPISSYLFKFLKLDGNMTTRKLHTILGYWGLIFLSFHLGLHFKMIFSKISNKTKNNVILRIATCFIQVLIIIYGIKLMIDNNLGDYLIGKSSFAIPNGDIINSFVNYFIIVFSIGLVVYNLEKLFIKHSKKRKEV